MHLRVKILLSGASAAIVAGCGTTSAVAPAATSKSGFDGAVYAGETVELEKASPGAELFRVFQQGATGFVSVDSVRGGVESIATQHCSRKGKTVRPIREIASKPPHVLGNFPRVEWIFECVDSPPPSTSALKPVGDRLDQVERLKKLLDSGALTQQEFDREKAKVLGSQ